MNKITTALKSSFSKTETFLSKTMGNVFLVPALGITVIMEWADSLTITNKKESDVE